MLKWQLLIRLLAAQDLRKLTVNTVTTGDEYESTLTLCFPDVALKQLKALRVTRRCELDDFGTLLRVARVQVKLDDLRRG